MLSIKLFLLAVFHFFIGAYTYANTKHDPHAPIDHCYHWIDEKSDNYLSFKYSWAGNHGNELTFYTTPGSTNGAVAGAGLYCAKSPSGSYDYGDRVIRIDLVEDVVLYDENSGIQYCGTTGETSQNSNECASKEWDIKFYSGGGTGNYAWYVIQNPMAVASWSANSQELISDLKASMAVNDTSFKNHVNSTLNAIEAERDLLGETVFFNHNSRMSIVDIILNDPEKLNGLPSLNVVVRLANAKDDRISEEIRNETYLRYLDAALKSDEIEYRDYQKATSKHKDVAVAFKSILESAIPNHNKYNSLVILKSIAPKLEEYAISDQVLSDLINEVFENKYHQAKIAHEELALNPKISNAIKQKLDSISEKDLHPQTIRNLKDIISAHYKSDSSKQLEYWFTKLYGDKGGSFGLKVGRNFYQLDLEKDFQNQCEGLFGFLGSTNEQISLEYKDLKVKLDPQSACKLGAVLAKTLKRLPRDMDIAYILKGRIESDNFVFLGSDYESINEQCHDFYSQYPGSKDEIYWSLNGSEERRIYYSADYWRSAEEVCSQLMSHSSIPHKTTLKWMREAKESSPSFIIEGRFESQKFYFYGENIEEINKRCETFYDEADLASSGIDDIYYSVNGSSNKKRHNSSGYWSTKSEICSVLLVGVSGQIPTRLFVEYQRDASLKKSPYILSGRFEKQIFIFHGKNSDEVYNQCQNFHESVIDKGIDDIYWSVNGSDEKRIYNQQSYWNTSDQLCGALINETVDLIPSQAFLKAMNFVKSSKNHPSASTASHTVSGRFEKQDFFFFGESSDEIRAQCEVYYPYLVVRQVYDIFYSVDGSSEKRHRNSSSYWNSKDALCSALEAAVKSEGVPSQRRLDYLKALSDLEKAALETNYKVTGKIESQSYIFFGNNREEVIQSCRDFHDMVENPSNVDDITYSINGTKLQSTRNSSSYWKDADSLCSHISSLIRSSIPLQSTIDAREMVYQWKLSAKAKNSPLTLTGKLAGEDFVFHGFDMDQVQNQCSEYVSTIDISSLIGSGAFLSLNLNKLEEQTWTIRPGNKKSLCSYVTEYLKGDAVQVLLAKNIKSSMDTFNAQYPGRSDLEELTSLRIESNINALYLRVSDADDANEVCIDIYPTLQTKLDQTNSAKLIIDGKEPRRVKISSYETEFEFCSEFKRNLYFALPNQTMKDHKKVFDEEDAKYKLTGTINGGQVYFFGHDKEDIRTQCIDTYGPGLDVNEVFNDLEINWVVNEDTKIKTFSLTETTMENFCNEFSEKALSGGLGRFFRSIF